MRKSNESYQDLTFSQSIERRQYIQLLRVHDVIHLQNNSNFYIEYKILFLSSIIFSLTAFVLNHLVIRNDDPSLDRHDSQSKFPFLFYCIFIFIFLNFNEIDR